MNNEIEFAIQIGEYMNDTYNSSYMKVCILKLYLIIGLGKLHQYPSQLMKELIEEVYQGLVCCDRNKIYEEEMTLKQAKKYVNGWEVMKLLQHS